MIVIDTDKVLDVIYAQSALYYHLHGGTRPQILSPDRRPALRLCVADCFATMAVRLAPYLDDVSVDDPAALSCTLRDEFARNLTERRLRPTLETALAHYAISVLALCDDRQLADEYHRQYTALFDDLEHNLLGCSSPVRLTSHWL